MNTSQRPNLSSRVRLADILDLFAAATHATIFSTTRAGTPVRGALAAPREVLAVDGPRVVLAGPTTGSRRTIDLSRMEGALVSQSGEVTVYLPGKVRMRVRLEHRRTAPLAKVA